MKKLTFNAIIICSLALLIFSCKKKNDPIPKAPQNPNEAELITTLKIIFTEQISGNVSAFSFRDIDGPGGNAPTKDIIQLDASKTYSGRIILLDETKSPVDSISNEVEEEKDDHQFFFTVTSANLTSSYTDYDTHGVPLGLYPNFVTGSASTGKLKVVLKHQPDIKPNSGNGNASIGETDIEVEFDVTIINQKY